MEKRQPLLLLLLGLRSLPLFLMLITFPHHPSGGKDTTPSIVWVVVIWWQGRLWLLLLLSLMTSFVVVVVLFYLWRCYDVWQSNAVLVILQILINESQKMSYANTSNAPPHFPYINGHAINQCFFSFFSLLLCYYLPQVKVTRKPRPYT